MMLKITVGVDEVGRGSLAGPIVGVAYICHQRVDGVKDSKLLSKKQREGLLPLLQQSGYWIESWVGNSEIDSRGIEWANNMVLKGSVEGLVHHYRPYLDLNDLEVLVDGVKPIYGLSGIKQRSIIQGDRLIYEISAASIIAKVERDRWITDKSDTVLRKGRLDAAADRTEPDITCTVYGWGKNAGYGTEEHKKAIKRHGLSELHRRSFCD